MAEIIDKHLFMREYTRADVARTRDPKLSVWDYAPEGSLSVRNRLNLGIVGSVLAAACMMLAAAGPFVSMEDAGFVCLLVGGPLAIITGLFAKFELQSALDGITEFSKAKDLRGDLRRHVYLTHNPTYTKLIRQISIMQGEKGVEGHATDIFASYINSIVAHDHLEPHVLPAYFSTMHDLETGRALANFMQAHEGKDALIKAQEYISWWTNQHIALTEDYARRTAMNILEFRRVRIKKQTVTS